MLCPGLLSNRRNMGYYPTYCLIHGLLDFLTACSIIKSILVWWIEACDMHAYRIVISFIYSLCVSVCVCGGVLLKARHPVLSTLLIDTAEQCECLDPRVQTAAPSLSSVASFESYHWILLYNHTYTFSSENIIHIIILLITYTRTCVYGWRTYSKLPFLTIS